MNVATTILAQLGGQQFIAMTGADYFAADGNSLKFLFKGCRAVNKCLIVLERDDTYSVSFYQLRGMKCPQVGETMTGVQAGELPRVFAEFTGLDCAL